MNLQHLTLLSHDPATKKDAFDTDGGENLRQETESSGGFVTSKSFIGFGVVDDIPTKLVDWPKEL